MQPSPDNAVATIEQMHAQVQASGTPEQQTYANQLLYGYNNVGIGIEISLRLHRDAMRRLLEEVKGAK